MAEISDLLNKKSGLLGLCGTADDRDVENGYFNKEKFGTLAKEVQVHRMRKYLGAYLVQLRGDVDAIVFTAGLGEKSHLLRTLLCEGLQKFGIEIDEEVNQSKEGRFSENICVSTSNSKIPIWVIPTDEELCIAQQTYALASKATSPQSLPRLLGGSVRADRSVPAGKESGMMSERAVDLCAVDH